MSERISIYDNPRWKEFRAQLEKAGATVRVEAPASTYRDGVVDAALFTIKGRKFIDRIWAMSLSRDEIQIFFQSPYTTYRQDIGLIVRGEGLEGVDP